MNHSKHTERQPLIIRKPDDVLQAMRKWQTKKQENFLTITLDSRHAIIKVHHVTMGLVNSTIVHPRECFYPAIKDLATAVLFVHNHPSGDTTPSPQDDHITQKLCKAGHIIGIPVIDHIIITPSTRYFSYREQGTLPVKFADYELDEFTHMIISNGKDSPPGLTIKQHADGNWFVKAGATIIKVFDTLEEAQSFKQTIDHCYHYRMEGER